MRIHKGDFFRRQEVLSAFVEKRHVHHLGVDDIGAEMPDQAHAGCGHGVDEGAALVYLGANLAGDGAAVDRVDARAVRCVAQGLAVEGESARVHEARVHARPLESVDEHGEVAHHGAFGEIGDGDGRDRAIGGEGVGCPDAQEGRDPRVDQLELRHRAFRGGEALEACRLGQLGAYRLVARHACGAVGVELAELEAFVVLVDEKVDAREGQQLLVAARQQDEALYLGREGKERAVARVFKVARDYLAEDGRGRCGDFFVEGHVVAVVERGHERKGDGLSVCEHV